MHLKKHLPIEIPEGKVFTRPFGGPNTNLEVALQLDKTFLLLLRATSLLKPVLARS